MRNVVFKIGMLAAIQVSAVAALASFGGCSAESPAAPEEVVGAARSGVTKSLTLHYDSALNNAGNHAQERCFTKVSDLPNGFVADRQVRISIPGDNTSAGACTLTDTPDGGVPTGMVYMNETGFRRVGKTSTADVTVVLNTEVVNVGFNFDDNDGTAQVNGDFYEHLQDPNPNNVDLVVLAPHGGNIDDRTDQQARVDVVGAMANGAANNVTSWQCYGYEIDADTSTHEHWHITSTDIDADSFPKLDSISTRGFRYALSFHGFKAETTAQKGRIYVGGNAAALFRQEIAEVINDALRDEDRTTPDDGVDATHDNIPAGWAATQQDNFVNWIASPAGGVQIEQSKEARGLDGPDGGVKVDHTSDVAKAAASVYRCLIDAPNAGKTIAPAVCDASLSVQGTEQEYDAHCGRFIADVSIPWTLGSSAVLRGTVDTTGLTQQQCGELEGYASIYKRIADRWERQAGGRIVGAWNAGTSSCTVQPANASFPNTLTVSPPASGVDQYRITVKGHHGSTLTALKANTLTAIASYTRVAATETCECNAQAPCHLEARTCTACQCLSLAQGESAPACEPGQSFECAMWPCNGRSAACLGGVCVVGQGGSSM